jgi:hypothetical protein
MLCPSDHLYLTKLQSAVNKLVVHIINSIGDGGQDTRSRSPTSLRNRGSRVPASQPPQ